MKFERTGAFDADWRRLSAQERELFRAKVRDFHEAAVAQAGNPGTRWPGGLRVKSVEGAPGIWEMTWSFSGPDGRATFEWMTIDGASGIRWRRIGGHAIFKTP